MTSRRESEHPETALDGFVPSNPSAPPNPLLVLQMPVRPVHPRPPRDIRHVGQFEANGLVPKEGDIE